MEVEGLQFLLILWACWTLLGFITLYLLTILNGHAESYFLYISETGDYFPESVLFTIVFTVSAVFDAFLSYCIYKYYAIKSLEMKHRYPHLQYTIFGLGCVACVGTVIVAMFPAVIHPVPHRIAAAISFLSSAICNTCQATLLYKLKFDRKCMYHLRMFISIMTVCCLIILFLARLLWWQMCTESLCLQITENIAVVTEWMGAIGILVYKLSHCADFQHLMLKSHSKKLKFTIIQTCGLKEESFSRLVESTKSGLHLSEGGQSRTWPSKQLQGCSSYGTPCSRGIIKVLL